MTQAMSCCAHSRARICHEVKALPFDVTWTLCLFTCEPIDCLFVPSMNSDTFAHGDTEFQIDEDIRLESTL